LNKRQITNVRKEPFWCKVNRKKGHTWKSSMCSFYLKKLTKKKTKNVNEQYLRWLIEAWKNYSDFNWCKSCNIYSLEFRFKLEYFKDLSVIRWHDFDYMRDYYQSFIHLLFVFILQELEFALKIFNYFFTSVFIMEATMKIIALGMIRYIKDR
jgi:hypothetical protein